MHSQLQTEEEVGVLEIFGGVRSEEEALAIKAGLEDLPGVESVEFLPLGVRLRFNPELADEQKFYAAVKKTNPRVEWIEYPDEGHGWYYERNKVDFWTRVEKFLNQNIGKN